ncbi:MAG TPA: DUF362 domain-containing protein [Candidatus Acutalibacter pullistercoris]|uniref:Ferredoxin n=1 Tax=Candidatus Acutalibacter pullistercoris TaxID=2838418 RepID=A0A9D1YBA2_9FIRM|nr:DUF362 domain-containing protein [Candidatus Acutalibacter pullistercoris]
MRNRVWLAQCPDYGQSLEEKIEKAFDALQVWDKIRPGMRVVLKPNLVMSSKPEQAIITHPAFTAAVGKCVQKAGGRVVIAESPGGPYTPAAIKAMFRATGYRDMAEACGFTLYTDCKSREVTLPQAKRCRELSVVEPFLDRDYLIDLPKLKTHSMVGFSGAVKNLFGTVPGLQKPELHCRFPEREPFSEMLCDLCHFLGPDLSLMDGIWAMEGNGPTGGQRRDLHVIAGSESPWALDVAAASLVGLEPEKIAMLREGHERGYGPLDLSELELVGDPMETLLAPDFLKAQASSTDFIDRLPKFLRPAAKKLATPYPRIDKKRCVGCGKCAESCPQHTITLREGKAVIRYQNCIRCFCCHEMCPKHVVQIKRLGLLRL